MPTELIQFKPTSDFLQKSTHKEAKGPQNTFTLNYLKACAYPRINDRPETYSKEQTRTFVCERGLNLDKVQRLLDMALSIVDSESEEDES